MDSTFNILDFISGLTGFVFDKAVLQNIAYKRGVADCESYVDLDDKTIELMRADCLYVAYCSPNTIASYGTKHGSYSKSIGSQVINDKERLYNMFMSIYKKYEDPMVEEIEGDTLQWLPLY